MKPSIGRIVTFKGIHSNGSDEHAAIITRVWTPGVDLIDQPGILVNLTVFADAMTPQFVGSVAMFDSRDAADGQPRCCFWPDRV